MLQDDRLFCLTDHLCRECGSRILEADDGLFICSMCGSTGKTHIDVCFCGSEIRQIGKVFECVKNPSPNPVMPAQVVIRERLVLNEPEIKQSPVKPRAHVDDTSYSMII